jgi:PRC-barrel domain
MRLLSGQTVIPSQPKNDAKAKKPKVKDDAPAIPPELLLRRDHNIRYERNGAVYATDGKVGTLKKVVVDEAAGEVVDLAVAVDGADRTVLLPPDLVDKTAGSAVFLTINRVQFAERAGTAAEYAKKHFARADVKAVLKRDGRSDPTNPRRAVANAGKDFVETPTVSPLDRLQRTTETLAAD